jgi:mono/diheme cytochrome c family protein/cytochrome bd-type quinol oxidase subunit 1
MNYPQWQLPGAGLLIAGVAILHVFISHFAVGGGLYLVVAETRARREGDAAMLAFLQGLSRFFILLTLVLGALTGVGIWFTIALVNPQAVSALVTSFVWGWAIEWTFFLTEIAAAMVYYYGWDRLTPRSHLAVGWIYFATAWLSLAVINGILSFMLTSGEWVRTRGFWDGILNPTYLPALLLRTLVATGLAGLYVVFAAAFVGDGGLRARIARRAALGWVLPAALVAPLALLWTLGASAAAGVPVGEILGAKVPGLTAAVTASFGPAAGGQPVARQALRGALVGGALLAAATLAVALVRGRRYARIEAGALLALGIVVLGCGEWTREALRKPWVIDRYLLVNGIRLPAPPKAPRPPNGPPDAFAIAALSQKGVLTTTPWAKVPAAWQPEAPSFVARPAAERAALAAAAGQELFRIECSVCHTQTGYLAIRPLVKGLSPAALEKTLANLARPLRPDGQPGEWSDPELRLDTWLGRRMPPFVGTDHERRAVAVYLARLGGTADAGMEEPAVAALDGKRLFEDNCALCHGAEAEWPIGPRLKGRSADQLFELLADLPKLNPDMPPFEGTEQERRALADHLGALSAQGGRR